MSTLKISLFAAVMVASGSLWAGHTSDFDDEYARPFPASSDDVAYAQVVDVQPRYRTERASLPRQECYDERVVYRDRPRHSRRHDGTAGAVIGGVIGGAIGHQVSAGSGRQIATVIGAIIGSDIGRNRAERYDAAYDEPVRERVVYEPRCENYYESVSRQQLDGYDVTYRYEGREYRTVMPYDPGNRIAVNVNVSPVR